MCKVGGVIVVTIVQRGKKRSMVGGWKLCIFGPIKIWKDGFE